MRLGETVRGVFNQIKSDARFRGSIVYKILLWIRNPRYAALRHREVRFYSRLLEKGRFGLIFDLGASAGSKAEIFRRHGRVVCVEPSAAAVKVLRTRFVHCSDVEVLEAAISNKSGCGTLLEFEPGSAYNTLSDKWAWTLQEKARNRFGFSMPQPAEKLVQLITIDELVSQYGLPRYIKIDVEGFECLAIQGMHQPCELLSAEFNLPEFAEELTEVICRLQQIGGNVLFNVAISEPPLKLEFSDWLSGLATLECIKEAGWRYVELFCRMNVKHNTALKRESSVQSSPPHPRSSSLLTLLVKSRRSTFNAIGVRATRDLDRPLWLLNIVYQSVAQGISKLTNRVCGGHTGVPGVTAGKFTVSHNQFIIK